MPNDEPARLVALSFDASDPVALARFWAAALRWDVAQHLSEPPPPQVDLVATDGTRFGIRFVRAAGTKTFPNRLHLDLTTTSHADQRDSVELLLERGGRHIDIGQGPDDHHVVLADPEGNELCIIEPENNFLSTCGRFGSITCDGTREVGYFWSAVLGWPLVWDQDEETAIRAPDLTGPMITWGGPPLGPKPDRNRLYLAIAPAESVDLQSEIERLVGLGARRDEHGRGDVGWIELLDPDGNEFRLLTTP
jgi:Glyoxalase-like domain